MQHVWEDKVFCMIITIPANETLMQGAVNNMVDSGFPAPRVMNGSLPKKHETTTLPAIWRSHTKCLRYFVNRDLHKKYHLMVCEDDCRFKDPSTAATKLHNTLHTLEKYRRWTCLHVGHVPLGPVAPVFKNLCITALPFTSHCLLWNRHRVEGLLSRIRYTKRKRPFLFEGNLSIPIDEKYAILPSLATQCVIPTEMKAIMRRIPALEKVLTFDKGESLMNVVAVIQFVLLSWLFLYGGYLVGKRVFF